MHQKPEIVQRLDELFGESLAESIVEIVPTGQPPISLHIVPAAEGRDYVTAFTTGMSSKPMNVPDGEFDDFRYAELFLQLPADWNFRDIRNPDVMWPFLSLRDNARKLHSWGEWLGAFVGFMANGEPPQPIHDGLPFTTWMFLNEHHFQSSDGRRVNAYRMVPLYTAERDFDLEHGSMTLIKAFDSAGISMMIDPGRKCVVSESSAS